MGHKIARFTCGNKRDVPRWSAFLSAVAPATQSLKPGADLSRHKIVADSLPAAHGARVRRPFRVPLVPLLPVLGILSCLLLMFSLPPENWLRLVVWLAIGLAIYFGYGRRHSVLARVSDSREHDAVPLNPDPSRLS